MEMALRPGLPSSLHSLPQQYSIPSRLWATGFHVMLERLRHALPSAPAAAATHAALLDHLTEFIYFAYAFYSNLLEAETFRTFRGAWIENLGDLARYRMAVAGLAASRSNAEPRPQVSFARIDDDDADKSRPDARAEQASIGTAALGDWELSEVETWRVTARDWYAKGLAETPGTGRLHHHLGVLARPDELRTLHHLCKSLTSAHAHVATRESLLPMFDGAHQRRRVQPDASASNLFVHLHGMLITRVQLDDWDATFERFTEALRAHAASRTPACWMQLAAINIAALLQYGAEDALLAPPENKAAQQDGKGSPPAEPAKPLPVDSEEPPLVLQHAIRLTFAILEIALSLDAAPSAYVTMLLTFLASTLKQPHSLRLLERAIPWAALVALASRAPETIDPRCEIASKISTDMPLPEDWCLRGMAWVGRRVYERGFWKSRGARPALCFESEVDVLSRDFEADEDEAEPSLATLRWRRAAYALTVLAKTVPGLDFDADAAGGRGALVLVDPLSAKCSTWLAEDLEAREASKRAQLQALPSEAVDDGEEDDDSLSEEEPDDANDSPEIVELKARRRKLKAILRAARSHTRSPATPSRRKTSAPARRAPVPLLPGYTILVLDTNIVLTAGSVLEQLVDSARWTVVVPLCVVTELDGLKRNATPLGADAARAIEYLETRLPTHAKCLKIQTSRGNYLPDLSFRTEEIDFGAPADDATAAARSLDEIILRAVEWQEAHFVDRRALLAAPMEDVTPDKARAVLVTLDRNLRLKARARGCHTIGHAELLPILAPEKG
jgi:rRNA-processing protein FCF1